MNNKKDAPRPGSVGRREFLQAAAMVSGASVALSSLTAGPAMSAAGPSESGEAIYLTDLGRCRPDSALSRKPRRNRWRLLDYQTDRLKGTMLVAGQNTAAPPVTCPLDRKGLARHLLRNPVLWLQRGQHPAVGALEDGHRLFPDLSSLGPEPKVPRRRCLLERGGLDGPGHCHGSMDVPGCPR